MGSGRAERMAVSCGASCEEVNAFIKETGFPSVACFFRGRIGGHCNDVEHRDLAHEDFFQTP